MPPLRPHRKTRTGCLQCRKRRVKCDESGHPCGNCAFRHVACTYPSGTSPDISQSSPVSPHTIQHAAQERPRQGQPLPTLDPSNKLLLELMHKFSTETCKSFFVGPPDLHIWQSVIPRRALDHDFLLDALLSVAALHTASSSDRHAARPYLDAAMDFQSRGLKPFQNAIQNISPENCDAVFVHSIITIVNGIVFPQIAAEVTEVDSSTVLENIFTLFKLVQGTAEISKLTKPWLQRSSLLPQDFWGSSSDSILDTEIEQALTRLRDLNRRENGNSIYPERHGHIDIAISRLRQCFQRFFRFRDPASVVTWLAIVDREFVDYLHREEPLPILVMVHWGVLLAELDGEVWWASKSGRALVADALAILERSGVDFGIASSWAREKVGL
ncbi:hypothetical protein ASPSYDRAFT_88030 [Aspergillus sydowii CBS 593.65]|uniref:Zn(2)-C6 fungal-type domain-containing protein n=1 Tax=Aspergillus sydowii CBS 593.65 TaxID=1036612 RepID=A0A1L9TPY0_9EURO|nr:uncharacterized protein ASPSYDRAFT_88030 [Aspergillus sydowii CBS 593.65]OJJ61484.1 hypothetical protein ASPSYDRAFT_88030 [Aspergillus sydowii CBS 593.65]